MENVRCFKSRYNGKCQLCHRAIKVGDFIAWKRNEYLAHQSCHQEAEIQAELNKPAKTDQQLADDVYWSNKAAEYERKQEEAAYRAKMQRNDAMTF